jgi:hypothetical protein
VLQFRVVSKRVGAGNPATGSPRNQSERSFRPKIVCLLDAPVRELALNPAVIDVAPQILHRLGVGASVTEDVQGYNIDTEKNR